MTFAQILSELLAGKRVQLRKKAPDDPRTIEYFRLPDGWESELELVAGRRITDGRLLQIIRRFPLKRFELERDDWEILEPSAFEKLFS